MSEENGKKTTVVPVYKKWWFWAIIGVLAVIGIIGGGSQNREDNKPDNIGTDADEGHGDKTALDGIHFTISSVPNDVTGKWRVSSIAQPIVISDYAYDYYKKNIKDDEEIHFIVNFTYNTTTKIAKTPAGINATVYEYIDGEEHDAKKLGSGMVLSDEYYNSTTGEKIVLKDDVE